MKLKDIKINELTQLLKKQEKDHQVKHLKFLNRIAYNVDSGAEKQREGISIEDHIKEEDNFPFLTEPSIPSRNQNKSALNTSKPQFQGLSLQKLPVLKNLNKQSQFNLHKPLPSLPNLTQAHSYSTLDKVKSQVSQRKAIIETNNYYCPYTKNKKFETFLEDLFEIGLGNSDLVSEISQYVQMIETFYNDKIQHYKLKVKEVLASQRKAKNIRAVKIDERRQLLEIFTDAVAETKNQILKRKLR